MTQTHIDELGGTERSFRLGIGELRQLQELCNSGPATIIARLLSHQPQAADHKRPNPKDYAGGVDDPDYLGDFNIYSLLRSFGGDWRVEDIRETIRLGLIGGGTTPTDASIAVKAYVDPRPLSEFIGLASSIILKSLSGDEDLNVGETKVETVTGDSSSPRFTA